MNDYILTRDWRGHRAGGQLQLSERDATNLIAAGIVQPIPAPIPPAEPEAAPLAEPEEKPKKKGGAAK